MRSFLFISAILILLILCHLSCGNKRDILDHIQRPNNSQALSDSIIRKNKVGNIVNEIADYNQLEDEIGLGNVKSEQYKRFEILQNVATRNDLLQLLAHKNAIVRTYAFWALTNVNDPSTFYIASHSQDTTFISCQAGCMSFSMRIKDFYEMFASRQLYKFPLANYSVSK
jgi:hypothetical protein